MACPVEAHCDRGQESLDLEWMFAVVKSFSQATLIKDVQIIRRVRLNDG
jgi:hypothetical protein